MNKISSFELEENNRRAAPARGVATTDARLISYDIALFSKKKYRGANAGGCRITVGLPLGFQLAPDDFNAEYEWAATPSRDACATTGLANIDPSRLNSGAWSVRIGRRVAYLSRACHIKAHPQARFQPCLPAEAQSAFVEQITFRFSLDDWAQFGPSLYRQAEAWLNQRGAEPLLDVLEARDRWPSFYVCEDDVGLSACDSISMYEFELGEGAPPLVIGEEILGWRSNNSAAPVERLLSLLTQQQRRTLSISFGHRRRARLTSMQVFCVDRLRRTHSGDPADEISLLQARRKFNARRMNTATPDFFKIVDLIAASDLIAPEDRDMFENRVRPMFRSLNPGAATRLRKVGREDARLGLDILETALESTLYCGGDTRSVTAAYRALTDSLLASTCHMGDAWLSDASWREFAPSMIAEAMFSRGPNGAPSFLEPLANLRSRSREDFTRLAAGMTISRAPFHVDWTALMESWVDDAKSIAI